jgi:hypothetical protein
MTIEPYPQRRRCGNDRRNDTPGGRWDDDLTHRKTKLPASSATSELSFGVGLGAHGPWVSWWPAVLDRLPGVFRCRRLDRLPEIASPLLTPGVRRTEGTYKLTLAR